MNGRAAQRLRTVAKYQAAFDRLTDELGRPPFQAELASACGVTKQRVAQIAPHINRAFAPGKVIAGAQRAARFDATISRAYQRRSEAGYPLLATEIAADCGVSPSATWKICKRLGLRCEDGHADWGMRRRKKDRYAAVADAHARLTASLGRHPMVTEIARDLGWNPGDVTHRAASLGLPLSRGMRGHRGVVEISRPQQDIAA